MSQNTSKYKNNLCELVIYFNMNGCFFEIVSPLLSNVGKTSLPGSAPLSFKKNAIEFPRKKPVCNEVCTQIHPAPFLSALYEC